MAKDKQRWKPWQFSNRMFHSHFIASFQTERDQSSTKRMLHSIETNIRLVFIFAQLDKWKQSVTIIALIALPSVCSLPQLAVFARGVIIKNTVSFEFGRCHRSYLIHCFIEFTINILIASVLGLWFPWDMFSNTRNVNLSNIWILLVWSFHYLFWGKMQSERIQNGETFIH